MTRNTDATMCPPEVLEWLPWYADDALPDAQRGAVEAHAAQCAECRAELEMLRGGPAPDVAAPDPEAAFANVLSRIESAGLGDAAMPVVGHRTAAAARQAPPRRTPHARARPWSRAAVAAGILAAGALGWIANGVLRDGAAPIYRTASDVGAHAPAADGPELDVVFRGDASVERVNTNLRALGAVVLAGPSQAGRYRVALPKGTDGAAAAQMLRAEDTGVASYAEPVRP
ncbi:MAG: hypothetical protein DCC71_10905 [Proteobacteria bacterium]|nr:MAG: hypothetical protein DCC71_10905 [Pseudomonadota bacterium]